MNKLTLMYMCVKEFLNLVGMGTRFVDSTAQLICIIYECEASHGLTLINVTRFFSTSLCFSESCESWCGT